MARKRRILYPSAFYHVMLRGNNKQEVFFSDETRFYFYSLLADGQDRYQYRIHAFCLMTNHIHLAIETGQILLPKIMHNLASRYTQRINKVFNRVGHIFQGRYKAILIDHNSYLLTLCRYIHLNPVHAGIVKIPSDYRWSSHRVYLGLDSRPWVTCDLILKQFSSSTHTARKLYQQFILSDESPFDSTQLQGRILGDKEFTEKALSQADLPTENKVPLEVIIEAVCNHFNISFEKLVAKNKSRAPSLARAFVAALSQKLSSATLVETGNSLNRDSSTLGSAIKRLHQQFTDKSIEDTFHLIHAQLTNGVRPAKR